MRKPVLFSVIVAFKSYHACAVQNRKNSCSIATFDQNHFSEMKTFIDVSVSNLLDLVVTDMSMAAL